MVISSRKPGRMQKLWIKSGSMENQGDMRKYASLRLPETERGEEGFLPAAFRVSTALLLLLSRFSRV